MKPLEIRNLRISRNGDSHRCAAMVDGVEVWFESDQELSGAPESFLSAFLLPAMAAGRDLLCDEPVDPLWLENNQRLQEIFHRWWGYFLIRVQAPLASDLRQQTGRSALLFSAGVDSFHTLLKHPDRIDCLLFAEGLDVKIDNNAYREHARALVRRVAASKGMSCLGIATNLRQHPLFKRMDYLRTHGAALAACAHQLDRHCGRLIINSSSVTEFNIPFGTHWDTDPLWSSSSLGVDHWGQHRWRAEKLTEIMREPIVRQNLRCCFERLSPPALNCGRCEKCVRTMLILHQHGQLDGFEALQPPCHLAESIDRVVYVKSITLQVYERVRAVESDPMIRDALDRLIRRNHGPLGKLRRSLYKRWLRIRDRFAAKRD